MNLFLTGATGFLGEYLLFHLLKRNHTVWALYRKASKRKEAEQFLFSLGLDPAVPHLHWLKGDVVEVSERWPEWEKNQPGLKKVDHILHSAASLRFRLNSQGEPRRTNLEGAKVLWRLTRQRPWQVHLISTAFVCGLIPEGTVFEVNHPPGQFVNAYDESKWEAEQVWSGQATILRPGVIVGDSQTGRCTSFTGWYIIAKGGYLMDQFLKFAPAYDRHDLRINVPLNPKATLNLVTVDYVAEAAVRLIENPVNHNRIFHLTHPHPPTHQWSHHVLCHRFDLGGIRFTDPATSISEDDDLLNRLIWNQTRRMYSYFSNNPTFDRTNTDRALPDLPVPIINESLTNKLLDYAISRNWGPRKE
jgi:nucleoside-diphosphate-sugar epimerase